MTPDDWDEVWNALKRIEARLTAIEANRADKPAEPTLLKKLREIAVATPYYSNGNRSANPDNAVYALRACAAILRHEAAEKPNLTGRREWFHELAARCEQEARSC